MIAILALSLVSVLSFANGTQEEGLKEGESYSFTAFIGESKPAYPENGTIVGNKIKEMTKVDVEVEWLVGDLPTRAGIMLASGELPDLLNARNEHYKFRSEGYLIPLEDLIKKHAPNLRRIIGDHWDNMFQEGPDGKEHIYAIPDLLDYGQSTLTRPDNGWYIQSIILEEAGWPQVTTIDEYWKLIEDYKERNPKINGKDTIGFQINAFDWYKWYVYGSASEGLAGYFDSLFRVEKKRGKWKLEPNFTHPDTKKYYKMMNEMYKKGLISPEGFVNTLDQYKESIASGAVLGTYQPEWVIQQALGVLKTEMPERTMVSLPLTWDKSIKDVYNETKTPAFGMGTSITTKCKNPVAAIKWLDALATDEIMMLGYWGVEGVDYYRDENGRVNRTAEQNKNFENHGNDYFFPVWGGEYWVEHFPSINGTFDDGTATRYGGQPEIFRNSLTDREREILDKLGWETFNSPFTPDSDPEIADRAAYRYLWMFTPETGTPEQICSQKLEMQIRPEAAAALIMAENDTVFEETWAKFIKDIESTPGWEEFKEFYQKSVDKKAGQ